MRRTPVEQERDLMITLIIAAAICFAVALVVSLTGCSEADGYEPDDTRAEAEACEIDLADWVHVTELRCDDPYQGWAIICVDGAAYELEAVGDVEHSCRLVRQPIEDRICIRGAE